MLLYAFIFERWKNIFKISLYIYCIYKIYMYICCIEIQKQIEMKIKAKDLKVGQDVKFGNHWIKVEKLIEGTQKNGKGFVQVCGTVYEGKIKSSYGNRKVESHYSDYNCPKLETLVTVR